MIEKDQFDAQAEGIFMAVVQSQATGEADAIGIGFIAATLRKQAWVNDAVYQGMVKENDELKARLASA